MKNWTIISVFIVLLSLPAFSQQDISKYAKPTNYINDFAEIITPVDEDALNVKLSNYEKSSGVEIAILTINEENVEPTGFSQQIFETWGVGKEGSDNGILIFLNMYTHDWRIHTGYGAEILLPDLVCDRLAQELLIPQFKEGNYTAGINSLTDGMIKKIGTNSADIEAFKAQYIARKKEKVDNFLNGLKWFFIITFIILAGAAAIVYLLKKIEERNKFKETFKSTLQRFNIIIDHIQDVAHPINTKYIMELLKPTDILIDAAILDSGVINKENLNRIEQYYTQAYQISVKIDEYARNYNIAVNADSYLNDVKKSLTNINKMSFALEKFPISPRLIYNKEKVANVKSNMDKLVKTVKSSIEGPEIKDAVSKMVMYSEQVKSIESELRSVKEHIPALQKSLEKYKDYIDALIHRLKSMDLYEAVSKVEDMTKEFQASVTFTDEKLYMEYDNFDAILKYGNSKIREVEEAEAAERRRKEEEANRIRRKKQEKEEEEERERRRRSSSYSSSSSSSSSFGRSSGSSFGGFGGGHSGGGGAGGRW